jgi:hypothetical protein
LVALDPANGGNLFTGPIDFKANARFSWAFNSSLLMGSNDFALTAHESFNATVGYPASLAAHSNIIELFSSMILRNKSAPDPVSSLFSLDRLLADDATRPKPGWWDANPAFEADLHGAVAPLDSDFRPGKWVALSASFKTTRAKDSVQIRTVSPDTGGDSADGATALGPLNAPLTLKNWIGQVDGHDYFSFTLSARTKVTIELSGLNDNADLELFKARGNAFAGGSYRRHDKTDTITTTLRAGTYYVHVYPQAYVNTHYTLTIS